MKTITGLLVSCLLTLGVAILPAPAYAGTETGIALVEGKDVEQGTVTLEGNRVYRVTKATEILDVSGAPITLAQLPTAKEVFPGMFEMIPGSTVEFTATGSGGTPTLMTLRVVGDSLE